MDTSTIGFSRDVVFHEDVPYGLWRSWPKEPRSLAAQSPLSCIPEDVPMQEASTDKDVADEDDDIVEVTTTAGPAASVSDDVEDDNEGDEDDELIDLQPLGNRRGDEAEIEPPEGQPDIPTGPRFGKDDRYP
jgi:hypothetical protein